MPSMVRKEISDQWAAKQCFSGPVMNIPVRTIPSEKDEKSITKFGMFYLKILISRETLSQK
jgi:inner membrane protein involved in colicin E2 resistance